MGSSGCCAGGCVVSGSLKLSQPPLGSSPERLFPPRKPCSPRTLAWSSAPGAPSLWLAGHKPSLCTTVPPLEQPVTTSARPQPGPQASCAGALPPGWGHTQICAPPRRGLTLPHRQSPLWPLHLHPQSHAAPLPGSQGPSAGPPTQGPPASCSPSLGICCSPNPCTCPPGQNHGRPSNRGMCVHLPASHGKLWARARPPGEATGHLHSLPSAEQRPDVLVQ